MTAIKLFNLDGGSATEILGSATALEKSLQHLIEQNLEPLLGERSCDRVSHPQPDGRAG